MPGIEIRRDFLIVASRLVIYNNNKNKKGDVFAQFIGMSKWMIHMEENPTQSTTDIYRKNSFSLNDWKKVRFFSHSLRLHNRHAVQVYSVPRNKRDMNSMLSKSKL